MSFNDDVCRPSFGSAVQSIDVHLSMSLHYHSMDASEPESSWVELGYKRVENRRTESRDPPLNGQEGTALTAWHQFVMFLPLKGRKGQKNVPDRVQQVVSLGVGAMWPVLQAI